MSDAGDYYDAKAKEAERLSKEIAERQAERYALQVEIRKLQARLEYFQSAWSALDLTRYVGD